MSDKTQHPSNCFLYQFQTHLGALSKYSGLIELTLTYHVVKH